MCNMAASMRLHHFGVYARNGENLVRLFTEKLTFQLFATRTVPSEKQWAVRSGNAVFIISQRNKAIKCQDKVPHEKLGLSFGNLHRFMHISASREPIDSVFNICFSVANVFSVIENILKFSNNRQCILTPPTTVGDSNGTITFALVHTGIGNIVHSLIDTSQYSGFLPGFDLTQNDDDDKKYVDVLPKFHFDHVTYACPRGSSSDAMSWYEKCFGMKRFLINREEDIKDGFTVKENDFGLRLKALESLNCQETMIASQPSESPDNDIKIVFAEPLSDKGTNQVNTFLEQHGGPGIQHVGLHTDDIMKSASKMTLCGVNFLQPPVTYYTKIGKLHEIQHTKMDVEKLKQFGILLDTEADSGEHHCSSNELRYLLQVFTKPLFDRDTFFLELIQRCGATGFGAGNITALWRSVQAFLDRKDH